MIQILKNLNLLEKKDHIIKKMPNLTQEQKDELIAFFQTHPNYEGKIDWNKWKTLSYKDFQEVLNIESKTAKKKQVKKQGIKGLKEGGDYLEIGGLPDFIHGYMPLNYEASKLIASSYVGGCEGEWCTAYQKDSTYWYDYTLNDNKVLIYFIVNIDEDNIHQYLLVNTDEDDSFKIAVEFNFITGERKIFEGMDRRISDREFEEATTINIEAIIEENLKLIEEAHEILSEQKMKVDILIDKIKNNEKLDSNDIDYIREVLENNITVNYESFNEDPLEVVILFDEGFFDDHIDQKIVSEYIGEEMPLLDSIYDFSLLDSEDAFTILTNEIDYKQLNEIIEEKFSIPHFDLNDYRSFSELEDILDEEFIRELSFIISTVYQNALEDGFYSAIYKAYQHEGEEIGEFVGPVYEKKLKLDNHLIFQAIEDLRDEIAGGREVPLSEYFEDIELGIRWDYFEPEPNFDGSNELFYDGLNDIL